MQSENEYHPHRDALKQAKRIVVKVGTRLLVNEQGRPDHYRIASLVDQLARLHKGGREVIFVSSGAIGAGIEALEMTERPVELAELQMAAAVGQARLMAEYSRLFAEQKIVTGQVLLTHDDLRRRKRHVNAHQTLEQLLRYRTIPVVNENDATAVDEIKVGDNDVLAALVAILVDADLLILLTSADGLLGPEGRIPYIPELTAELRGYAKGKGSDLSTGGMGTKLSAAEMVSRAGAFAMIANGSAENILDQIMAGEDVGSLLGDGSHDPLRKRKAWLRWFQRPVCAIRVDDGACKALIERGTSLLPIGVTSIKGKFSSGVAVKVTTEDGISIAHGLTRFSSEELEQIKGCQSHEIEAILGTVESTEAIHRDDLVLLSPESGTKS